MYKHLGYQNVELQELIGKTMESVVNKDDDELIFTTIDGEVFKLYHSQDCCESVTIDDIVGDLQDLVGAPILVADEVSCLRDENPEGIPHAENQDDSFTWTFYKFATIKGYVDIRWYGESNGYYSESVDFARVS